MSRRIDQLLAGFAEGDAISNAATCFQEILRAAGYQSEIYVDRDRVSPRMADHCRSLNDYAGADGDVVIHHYSIGSQAIETFLQARARKVLVYHNITPPDYFRGYDDAIVSQLEAARTQLADSLRAVDAVWAVSEFNASELRALGAPKVDVFPLVFSPEQFDLPPDPWVFVKLKVPLTNLLFVGRIAPNKKIEELIHAFAWYHHVINPRSRLLIVGSERTAPRYTLMLRMLARELNLPNVCFERFASPEGLSAYYNLADLFVTTSDHEGFCLPLVEAMHRGVPVIAKRRGGIPEALGRAGVMIDDCAPEALAELMHRVVSDTTLRSQILDSQARRMAELRNRDIAAELRELIDSIG